MNLLERLGEMLRRLRESFDSASMAQGFSQVGELDLAREILEEEKER